MNSTLKDSSVSSSVYSHDEKLEKNRVVASIETKFDEQPNIGGNILDIEITPEPQSIVGEEQEQSKEDLPSSNCSKVESNEKINMESTQIEGNDKSLLKNADKDTDGFDTSENVDVSNCAVNSCDSSQALGSDLEQSHTDNCNVVTENKLTISTEEVKIDSAVNAQVDEPPATLKHESAVADKTESDSIVVDQQVTTSETYSLDIVGQTTISLEKDTGKVIQSTTTIEKDSDFDNQPITSLSNVVDQPTTVLREDLERTNQTTISAKNDLEMVTQPKTSLENDSSISNKQTTLFEKESIAIGTKDSLENDLEKVSQSSIPIEKVSDVANKCVTSLSNMVSQPTDVFKADLGDNQTISFEKDSEMMVQPTKLRDENLSSNDEQQYVLECIKPKSCGQDVTVVEQPLNSNQDSTVNETHSLNKSAEHIDNSSECSTKLKELTEPSSVAECSSESLKDECKQVPKLSKPSPKTNQGIKSRTPPKRNLKKNFHIERPKNKFNTKEDTVCEFFIADKKTEVEMPVGSFDEELAEEAASLSQHFQNLSDQMQDSDLENSLDKTVISATKSASPTSPPAFPQRSKFPSVITQREDLLRNLPVMANDVIYHETYEQSMHSVLPAHLNQSEAGPITADELSTQDLEFQDGAKLDLDFFNRVGSKEETLRHSLTRDSLYVKFDPIVNAIVSKTVESSFKMPHPPAEQEKFSEENNESDPTETNAEETDSSPKTPGKSPALEAVQKLISLTPPPPAASPASASPSKSDRNSAGTPTSVPPKSAYISPDQLKRELTKLENIMREREKYFEIEMEKKDNELKSSTSRRAELEAELKATAEREHRLKKEVVERTKSKQQLGLVMEEYEKTISQLVAQKEEDKKEFEIQKDLLMKERDTAMQHLNNMEIAFNDVHQKYERSKTVIEGMKVNEDSLRKSLAEYDDAIKTSNTKYESLKNHAIKQLETANQELDLIRRSHQAELAKLKAMLKKAEVRVTSLEESLEQKSKENQELAAICDELISKVGSSN